MTAGRTVVFDEFPDAYETLLWPELQGAVSCWLESIDGIPFDSYTDPLESRSDEPRRSDALLWFEEVSSSNLGRTHSRPSILRTSPGQSTGYPIRAEAGRRGLRDGSPQQLYDIVTRRS